MYSVDDVRTVESGMHQKKQVRKSVYSMNAAVVVGLETVVYVEETKAEMGLFKESHKPDYILKSLLKINT